MREGFVRFPPTYKFQRHQPDLAAYNSGEKRIPAWCDRIVYRDSRSESIGECSLECPIVAAITSYEASMDVADSDHKPVNCTFSVDLARVDELIRRQEHYIISTNSIILENQETVVLRKANTSGTKRSAFEILCEGQSTSKDFVPRASYGFPHWLEEKQNYITLYQNRHGEELKYGCICSAPFGSSFVKVQPSIGLTEPGETMEVTMHHKNYHTQEEFVDGVTQNGWCEVTRHKEAVLLVNVRASTETVTHRINVGHCCAASAAPPTANLLSITAPPGDAPSSEGRPYRTFFQEEPVESFATFRVSDFALFGSSEVHEVCGTCMNKSSFSCLLFGVGVLYRG